MGPSYPKTVISCGGSKKVSTKAWKLHKKTINLQGLVEFAMQRGSKSDKQSVCEVTDRMNVTDNENYRKIHFAVMAIENGAEKLNISGQEMEDRLQKQDLIRQRLFGQYELLHTQSLDYVAEDIAETLLNWEQNHD